MIRSNLHALLFTVLLSGALAAQDTGSLYGTVTDPAGGLVPNAQVTATSQERGNIRTAASNERGEWVLTQMPIGTYTVKVEAQGPVSAPSTLSTPMPLTLLKASVSSPRP